jgi:transposase
MVVISARYQGRLACPECAGTEFRSKGVYWRRVRHESLGTRHCVLELEARKWLCKGCGRQFRQQSPASSGSSLPAFCAGRGRANRSAIACSCATLMASAAADWASGSTSAAPPSNAGFSIF